MGMTVSHAMFYCVLPLHVLIALGLIHGYTACQIKKPAHFLNNSLNTLEQYRRLKRINLLFKLTAVFVSIYTIYLLSAYQYCQLYPIVPFIFLQDFFLFLFSCSFAVEFTVQLNHGSFPILKVSFSSFFEKRRPFCPVSTYEMLQKCIF